MHPYVHCSTVYYKTGKTTQIPIKTGKQPKYPSRQGNNLNIHQQMNGLRCGTYTQWILLSQKKNKIMPFAATRMDLEIPFFLGRTCSIWRSQTRGQIRAAAAGYTTAIVTWDLSRVCDLNHSSQQHRILNLLREARD